MSLDSKAPWGQQAGCVGPLVTQQLPSGNQEDQVLQRSGCGACMKTRFRGRYTALPLAAIYSGSWKDSSRCSLLFTQRGSLSPIVYPLGCVYTQMGDLSPDRDTKKNSNLG